MRSIDSVAYRVSELFEPQAPLPEGDLFDDPRLVGDLSDPVVRRAFADALRQVADEAGEDDPLNVVRQAAIVEAGGRIFMWFSEQDEVKLTELPPGGGPDYARCALCGEWLWIPPGCDAGGTWICTGGQHDDDELTAAGFET